ncbi:hypothetical protein ABGB17_14325 [Sphaerisporangium sp. B11E5]|uniref:nSTAND1 domain-containing NTPase n=1 Tax=Sphaerisporangium sp. B11E5 TaxID=3153563 RepID=UPI00325D5CE5
MTAAAASDDFPLEPYVGLRSYTRHDHERFYGRDSETIEIAVRWPAHRLTVLYGPSGVGKTSLLHAGVLPRLEGERVSVLPIGRLSHGSAFPMAAVPQRNPFTFALLSSWAPEESPMRLSGLTVGDFLHRLGTRRDRYGDPMPLLVAIDQAEELFYDFPHRTGHRDLFIRQLVEALERNKDLRLLLTIREDYLARLLPYEQRLSQGEPGKVSLGPFDERRALTAIRAPLEGTGRSFAPGAAERLVRDLRTVEILGPGGPTRILTDTIEPVALQVVCSSLWRSCPQDLSVITPEHVDRHTDVDRSLSEFLDRALTEVAGDHDIPVEELRRWLRATFITELGTRASAYGGTTQTAGMRNSVVKSLIDRHVLKTEVRSGSRWCELQHDRLLQPVERSVEQPVVSWNADSGPASASQYLHVAGQALAEGELDLAEAHAKTARSLCGDGDLRVRAEIESFLGNVALSRAEWAEAEVRWAEAVERHRQAAHLYEALGDTAAVGVQLAAIGRLRLLQGRTAEAIDHLRAAVARVPHDLMVKTQLSWALWNNGDHRAALPIVTEVLELGGDVTLALRVRGELLADLGRAAEALRDLDRIRGRQPDATTVAARALTLALLGERRQSLEEVDAALAMAPDHGLVAYFAARAVDALGDQERAMTIARQAAGAANPPLTEVQHRRLATLL